MKTLHISKRRFGNATGFTLVEIALAMGVVTFAIVAILGMIPVAVDAARESKRESRVTTIARSILSDLRSGTFHSTLLVNGSPATASDKVVQVDLGASPTTVMIAYDTVGSPVGPITLAQFDNGTGNADMEFVARVTITPLGSGSVAINLCAVRVEIETPGAAASVNRRKYNVLTEIGAR